ncbi:MAG TPA: hypothetical protein VNH41_06105 [Steroidobacteraceae bacterium]|nr:hypothetical protein [Steroidobacteraceae bacterium]
MPAEQEARKIAESIAAVPNHSVAPLARAYLALEAELLAAQEAGDNALFDIGKLREQLQAAQASLKANQDELRSCQEREKALQVRADTFEQAARFHAGREKALRDLAERFVESPVFSPLAWQEEFRRALAGSPSEKPGSEEEACPRCGATPDGGTSLDCPVCTGVTDAD